MNIVTWLYVRSLDNIESQFKRRVGSIDPSSEDILAPIFWVVDLCCNGLNKKQENLLIQQFPPLFLMSDNNCCSISWK